MNRVHISERILWGPFSMPFYFICVSIGAYLPFVFFFIYGIVSADFKRHIDRHVGTQLRSNVLLNADKGVLAPKKLVGVHQ